MTLACISNEIVAAVSGAVAGAFLTYLFAINLANKQFAHLKAISKIDAWHVAARAFISDFADDIAAIESETNLDGDIRDYLNREYRRHAKAVAVFEHFVTDTARANFKAEWQKHCYGETGVDWPSDEESSLDHDEQLFLHYDNNGTLEMRRTARSRAVSRMNALLEYAKET